MKVLILTKTFPESLDEWGGIFVREQASAISTAYDVTVVKCVVDYSKFSPFFRFRVDPIFNADYSCLKITVSKSFPVYNQLNFIGSVYLALNRIIRHNKPHIIHCHYSYPSGIVAWLLKLKTGIPFVITEHSRIRSTFRSVFHRILSLVALRNACHVIAVSNSLKSEIIHEGVKDAIVVHNVIDVERFTLRSEKPRDFTIGFLGELKTHNKGLDLLLGACQNLPFQFKLKIVGKGNNLQYYKDLSMKYNLSSKTDFIHEVNAKNISDFYSQINLFILPSRYETFGMVLIEALASGIPVISTRCGGPEDIVNKKTGILTEIDNQSMLSDAIINIYSNYDKYIPQELRQYIISNFSIKPFLNRINSIYESCL